MIFHGRFAIKWLGGYSADSDSYSFHPEGWNMKYPKVVYSIIGCLLISLGAG
jgi:hypothetical protein